MPVRHRGFVPPFLPMPARIQTPLPDPEAGDHPNRHHPRLSPQQAVDALGTDAARIFQRMVRSPR
jgi:hypothetical protein